MNFGTEEPSNYRVEVSGWDARENFFVEKTLLAWDKGGKKEITVQTGLRTGCVIFVRLLQRMPSGGNFPVAYHAVEVCGKDPAGRWLVSLEQLRPREVVREPRLETDAVYRVA